MFGSCHYVVFYCAISLPCEPYIHFFPDKRRNDTRNGDDPLGGDNEGPPLTGRSASSAYGDSQAISTPMPVPTAGRSTELDSIVLHFISCLHREEERLVFFNEMRSCL